VWHNKPQTMSRPDTGASRASRGSAGSRTRAEWDVDKHMMRLSGVHLSLVPVYQVL